MNSIPVYEDLKKRLILVVLDEPGYILNFYIALFIAP